MKLNMISNNKTKNVLVFGYHDINRDPRAFRQINWLSKEYNVDYISVIPNKSFSANFIPLPGYTQIQKYLRILFLLMRFYRKYSISTNIVSALKKIRLKKYDVAVAHHINLLPALFIVKENIGKIIIDAHEYYTEVYDESFLWRMLMKPYHVWLSKNYLMHCDLLIAVNESMKIRYENEFRVKSEFLTNAVDYEEHSPMAVDQGHIRMIHHGLASPSRKLEYMIEIMENTDFRFTLTFILLEINRSSTKYVEKLKKMAEHNTNINFLPPLEMSQIIQFSNQFDIGLFFMPPTNYNEEYSLANKVFQFIQSRLMLAFSPLPEMKKIVEDYNLGIVSEDFRPIALAKKLNQLRAEDIFNYKLNSHKYAHTLSSDCNRNKFMNLVRNELG